MAFKLQTACKTPFRGPSPVVLLLLKLSLVLEKREYTLKVVIRFLSDNKPNYHEGSVQKTMNKYCYSPYVRIIFEKFKENF